MHRCAGVALLLLSCGGRPPVAEPQPIVVPPLPANAAKAEHAAAPPCIVEGAGEPVDAVLYHHMEELGLAATRGGGPLLRTQSDARHKLYGRWSELPPPKGDGVARLTLAASNAFEVAGYTPLSAVRFRLRRELAVVPDHVFLQTDTLVRILGADGPQLEVTADVPFDSPKELTTRASCEDVGYEPTQGDYEDAAGETTGHVDAFQLFDAPGGRVRFEAKARLLFVRELETSGDFVRIEAARYRVRFAGWMRREQVEHHPVGSGSSGGGRSYSGTRKKGREMHVVRKTPLLVRRGAEAPVPMGLLLPGAKLYARAEPADLVAVQLRDAVIDAVEGASIVVRAADIDDGD